MRQVIPFLFLVSSTVAVIFDCNFARSNLPFVSEYTCRPIVSVSGDSTTLTEVRGNHLDSNTNEDVKAIHAENQQVISQLPKDLEKFFPNLIAIVWEPGNLSSITVEDLKSFPNLLLIGLSGNQITTLDGNLFQGLRELKYINFNRNHLISVGTDLLANLDDLQFARFGSNPCISFDATSPWSIVELKGVLERQCPPMGKNTIAI